MFSPKTPSNLFQAMQDITTRNKVHALQAVGNQPRPGQLSPNASAVNPSGTVPGHVSEVRAVTVQASDVTSKVTVTFSRNPNDYQFVDARVFVSGYKGNPAPVQVASGQSPISFSLENTGEPVAVSVQASGNTGQAPISTAPSTTLILPKTNLATTVTAGGNGTGGATFGLSAPSWWSSGDGSPFSFVNNNASFSTGSANQIKFWRFRLPYAIQIGNFALRLSGVGAAGSLAGLAIYSADGNTKYCSWDAIDTSVGNNHTFTLSTPVALQPGSYIFACGGSGTNTSQQTTQGGYSTEGSSEPTAAWNINGVASGTASNALSSGVMPATLGTLATSTAIGATVPLITMRP